MRFLFVHQNFPGQFLHLVRHLAAQRAHEVVFITEPNKNNIQGVRRLAYKLPRGAHADTHPDAQEIELAMMRAAAVAQAGQQIKSLGFVPDIVIGHHGWGELLNIQDVWPDVPLLGYHEFYYNLHGMDVGFDPEFPSNPAGHARIRAKNAVNLLALTNPGRGQTPTRFQRSTYPPWARDNIAILYEGVNLDSCCPDPDAATRPFQLGGFAVQPGQKLLTYVARDLEPYRGFHVVMRALPRILRARPDVRVVLVGGDGVSYGARLAQGNWRERMLTELGGRLDTSRIHFPGKVAYTDYVRLLQRSDAHVYITYPFVASWSLRESMACGCAIVASDTAPVQEFVTDGQTGLLTPCLDSAKLADRVLHVLEGGPEIVRLRHAARLWAETNLRMTDHIARYEALIAETVGA